MKPSFSVCLIARNEEKTLPRLVSSLKEFQERGGEIIVVDTGSTDNTTKIARDLGCKVEEVGNRFLLPIDAKLAEEINWRFVQEKEDPVISSNDTLFDFSSARNYAASLASNDIIAMPDADEVYTKLDLNVIEMAIQDGVEQFEYNFVFAHDPDGKPVIQFLHSKFYDRRRLKWEGIVHEILQGEAKRSFFDPSAILLEHFQNETTNRTGYLKGLALDCFSHPEKDRQSHYFARELMYSGRFSSAIHEFQRHVSMNKWEPECSQSWVFMGDCELHLGNEEGAVHYWHDAFSKHSGRREPLIRLAEYYYRKNDPQRVAAYASAALTIPQSNYYANNAAHYQHIPHELLYWAFWYLGDREKSREHWLKALSYQPHNPKFIEEGKFYLPSVSIVIPHLSLGNEERNVGLKKCLDSIEKLNYPKELVSTHVYDGEGTVPNKVKRGVEESKGDYIVYAANDTEFDADSLMNIVLFSESSSKRLVSFNTGVVSPDEGNICEHFIIKRDLIPEIGGEVFNTKFYHVGVDNLLWSQCKKLREAVRCEQAIMHHHHFSKPNGNKMDDVYKKGWQEERVKHDRDLLAQELEKLK